MGRQDTRSSAQPKQGINAERWASLVSWLIRSFVKYPDAVLVTGYDESRGPLLVIEVDERDRGQVIGKSGRNLQAIERAIALNPTWRPTPKIELQG